MNLVPNGMAQSMTRQMLVAKKNSPHIFFGAGVVGVIVSTVLACRATLKLEDTLDEIKEEVDELKDQQERALTNGLSYSERDQRKDLARVYVRSAGEVAKLYGPSVLVGVASIGALTGSHVQLTRRNSALSAAIAVVSQAYDDYRDRVREAVGEERELDIHRGITTEKVKIDGKMVEVKALNPGGGSAYSFMFDKSTAPYNWKEDAFYNRTFLEAQQTFANQRLVRRGHVFLNEILDDLGMDQTPIGALVGWVYDRDGNTEGDNYIDFGIFTSEKNLEFTEGSAYDVFLDFNVDGVIWNKIGG